MEALWGLLKEARSEIVGGIISGLIVAAILAVVGKALAIISMKQTAVFFVIFAFAVVGLMYAGVGIWTSIIVVAAVAGILTCAHLAFRLKHPRRFDRRKPPKQRWFWQYNRWYAVNGKQPWKFPRLRTWALAGLVAIPLLAASGVSYLLYQQSRPPTKVIILVADFDGPQSQKYRVTELVLNRLRIALELYNDVRVEALERAITEAAGSAAARVEGNRRKATIVIWGWYGPTSEAVTLSVHYEVLRPPRYLPELGPEVKGQVQVIPAAELESFNLQSQLSEEMAYLSLFTVGMVRFAVEDWDGAIARFGDALSQITEHESGLDRSTVHFYRGNAYNFKGNYDQAIADFDLAIELRPDFATAYTNRGYAYFKKGDLNQVIDNSTRAIQLQPDDVVTHLNFGGFYLVTGDYDQALAELDKAIELRPDFAEAYDGRGLTYYYKGDYERAIADYNQAIQFEPRLAGTYNNRGNAYADRGDYERAITDYNKAIELQPGFALAYTNRGFTYYEMGDNERAIADYNRAIELQPEGILAYLDRGFTNIATGFLDEAIADFNQAIQLDPDNATAYGNRGISYFQKGNYDQAIADYNKAIQLQPYDARTYNNRGLVHVVKGDYDKAIADYNRAIELQPGKADIYSNRGLAYARKGDYGWAIADFNRAIEIQPDHALTYYSRGIVYAAIGEPDGALSDFKIVLELTDDPDLRNRASEMLRALGRE